MPRLRASLSIISITIPPWRHYDVTVTSLWSYRGMTTITSCKDTIVTMKIHSQSYEILKWFPIVFISILVHSGIRLSNNNWSHCPSSGRSGCWTLWSLYCCPPIGFSIRWIWFIIRLVRSVHDRFIAKIKDFIIFRFLAQTH